MEVLRNLFGNLSSGIIRLAVTVGILAAVYFFIVHPVLDTTEKTVHETNQAFEHSFENSGLDKINKTIENVNKQVQTQIHRSFHVAKVHGGPKQPEKLLHCVQHANGDVMKMERCTRTY
jgi:hypothetical protein